MTSLPFTDALRAVTDALRYGAAPCRSCSRAGGVFLEAVFFYFFRKEGILIVRETSRMPSRTLLLTQRPVCWPRPGRKGRLGRGGSGCAGVYVRADSRRWWNVRADGRVCVRRAATMPARAGNLLRLAARRVQGAPALRAKPPLRGGAEGPDPNAVSFVLAARPAALSRPAAPNRETPPPMPLVRPEAAWLPGGVEDSEVKQLHLALPLLWDGRACCLAPVTAQLSA